MQTALPAVPVLRAAHDKATMLPTRHVANAISTHPLLWNVDCVQSSEQCRIQRTTWTGTRLPIAIP